MTILQAGAEQRIDSSPPAPDAPALSPTRRVPMALRAGLILGVVCGVVTSLRLDLALSARDGFGPELRELLTRWSMLAAALAVATGALAAAGAAELVRRTRGLARHGARLLRVGLLIPIALTFIFYFLYYRHEARNAYEAIEELSAWTRQLHATSWLLVASGALLAGWHERRVRQLAAPLVVACLLAHPYDFYGQALYSVFEHRWASSSQHGALNAWFVAMLLLALRRGAPLEESGGGWHAIAAALDRVASTFYARLWITALSITLAMLAFGNRDSAGLAKLWLLGVPLGVAVANLAAVHGLLDAGRPTTPQAPRRTLYLAGTLLAMTSFLSVLQLFRAFHGWPYIEPLPEELPLVLPILGGLAHVALAHALEQLSWQFPSLELRDRAWASKLSVAFSQLVLVGLQYYMTSSPTRDVSAFALLLVLTVGAAAVTLVSQARLCRALSRPMRERNDLPTAQLIVS